MRYFSKSSCLVLFLCMLVASCTPRVDQRGRFLEKEQVSRILPKIHNKQDVQRLLGSPSTVDAFGGDMWVYTGTETETTAFFSPEVSEFQQLRITFDSTGFVQKVDPFPEGTTPEDISLVPATDKTPVKGYKEGFFQQMFGNFGRFARSGDSE